MIKQTALAFAAIVAGVSAQAEEAKSSALSVTVDVTYVSDYVFRAVKASDDAVQPSVEATYGDFYAGLWHSDDVNSSAVSETDLYAGYGYKIDDTFKLDGGVTRYTYDGSGPGDTTEVFIGATASVLLSPSLYYYYDFDREASTIEASIGYSFPIDAIKSSIDLSGKVGYVTADDAAKAGLAEDNYTYYSVGASVPYKLSETATLTVGVDYIYNSEDTVAGFGGGDNDQIVGKAGISIGF